MAVVVEAADSAAVAGFDFGNLTIERLIVHRVYERGPDKSVKPPKLSGHITRLPKDGADALQRRITSALGSRSHGVEMSIENVEVGSFFQLASDVLHATDGEFVETSKQLARKLSEAQGLTVAPAGMLAVLRGRVGTVQQRYLAVIKADVHDGFGTQESDDEVDVTYLTSLMLTPTQKLYKVGLLLEENAEPRRSNGIYAPERYRAFLFDHLITSTETRTAAAYFYGAFLGMSIQKSSRKLTQDFFEHTRAFIDSSPIDVDVKLDLKEALRVELRSDSAVIDAPGFAKKHFPKELRRPYQEYLESKAFPKNAVVKDTEYVKSRLRRPRKLIFTSGVRVFMPATGATDLVTVISSDREATTLKIQGTYTETE